MGAPKRVVVSGRVVFLCCDGCEAALQRDPERVPGEADRPRTAHDRRDHHLLDPAPDAGDRRGRRSWPCWATWAAWETPVDAIPDLSENQVIVFTEWKGHGPREIEDQVTYPLTLGLRGLRGVRVVRSSSDVGFSMISVIFDDGYPIGEARRRVAERLASVQAQLPAGATPELAPDCAGDRPDLLVHGRGGRPRPGPAAGDPGLVRPPAARLGPGRGGGLERRRVSRSSTRSRPTPTGCGSSA